MLVSGAPPQAHPSQTDGLRRVHCTSRVWPCRHGFNSSINRMARFASPTPRKNKTKRTCRGLPQVGHLPSKRQVIGLPPPPTTPLLKPYTFRTPIVVKVAPTAAGGSQSGTLLIVLGPTSWVRRAGPRTQEKPAGAIRRRLHPVVELSRCAAGQWRRCFHIPAFEFCREVALTRGHTPRPMYKTDYPSITKFQ